MPDDSTYPIVPDTESEAVELINSMIEVELSGCVDDETQDLS